MVHIRVAVRVRPGQAGETSHTACDERIGTLLSVEQPSAAEREFGIVLGPAASQNDTYVTCGAPMLEAALQGQDSLLFTFGANSTGKTYSLYGADSGKSQNVARLDGIVPTVVTELFKRTLNIEKGGESKFGLSATYVEVQGTHLVDLFADDSKEGGETRKSERVVGDPAYVKVQGAQMIGATSERVFSSRSLLHLIERALARRQAASGAGSSSSSSEHQQHQQHQQQHSPPAGARGHGRQQAWQAQSPSPPHARGAGGAGGGGAGASSSQQQQQQASHQQQNHRILTLLLERRRHNAGVHTTTHYSRVCIVDLAGSDNFDQDGAKEGRWINRGCLAVGRVVIALAEGAVHVPYRDYPLTTLLAAILGSTNTTYAMMLTCISPAEQHAVETRTTLEYASKGAIIDKREREEYERSQGITKEDPVDGVRKAVVGAAAARNAAGAFKKLTGATGSSGGEAGGDATAPATEAAPAASGAAAASSSSAAAAAASNNANAGASASASGGAAPAEDDEGQQKAADDAAPATDDANVPWTVKMMAALNNTSGGGGGDEHGGVMSNDATDPQEELNRRTELIETKNGHVFCRACGDAGMPLILYVHGSSKESSSISWNACVTALADAKQQSTKLLLAPPTAAAGREMGGEEAAGGGGTSRPAASSRTGRASTRGGKRASSRSPTKGTSERTGLMTSATMEGDDQGAEPTEYDDRFAKLRTKVSAALLRRQRELAQTSCSLCQSLLLQPRRMTSCRHVLCALCVERSVLYHNECPVCSTPVEATPPDVEHDELMRMRIGRLPSVPKMVKVWHAKLEEAEAERRESMRILLEFGSVTAADGKVTVFLGLVRQKLPNGGYSLVHCTSACPQSPPLEAIERLTIDATPEIKDPERVLDALTEPNRLKDERMGYMLSKRIPRGKTVVLTVYWAAELGLAPLEIRHKVGRVPVGRFERRIVVQLPSEMPVLQDGQSRTPVVYSERRDKELSGWVQYLTAAEIKSVGTTARVQMGAFSPKSSASAKMVAANGKDVAMTSQMISETRKQVDAALNAEDVVGSVVQAALTLAIASAQGLPLSSACFVNPLAKRPTRKQERASAAAAASPAAVLLSGGPSSPDKAGAAATAPSVGGHAVELPIAAATIAKALQTPISVPEKAPASTSPSKEGKQQKPSILLRSAASGGDVGVVSLYEKMTALVGPAASAQLRKIFLSELSMSPQDEPAEFFQVAVDMPGHGKVTTLRRGEQHVTADLLADVIRGLGKQSAFAIVGAAEAAPGILQAVLERPSLCSFLVCVDPEMPKSTEALFGVFQPTLFVAQPASTALGSATRMAKMLLHNQVYEYTARTQQRSRYFDAQIGDRIVQFFKERHWRGVLKGYGISRRIPQMTQLAGGIRMWEGKRQDASPLSVEEQQASRKQAAAAAVTDLLGSRAAARAPSAARPTSVSPPRAAYEGRSSAGNSVTSLASTAAATMAATSPTYKRRSDTHRAESSRPGASRKPIGRERESVSPPERRHAEKSNADEDDVLMPLPNRFEQQQQQARSRARGGRTVAAEALEAAAMANLPPGSSVSTAVTASVAAAMAALRSDSRPEARPATALERSLARSRPPEGKARATSPPMRATSPDGKPAMSVREQIAAARAKVEALRHSGSASSTAARATSPDAGKEAQASSSAAAASSSSGDGLDGKDVQPASAAAASRSGGGSKDVQRPAAGAGSKGNASGSVVRDQIAAARAKIESLRRGEKREKSPPPNAAATADAAAADGEGGGAAAAAVAAATAAAAAAVTDAGGGASSGSAASPPPPSTSQPAVVPSPDEGVRRAPKLKLNKPTLNTAAVPAPAATDREPQASERRRIGASKKRMPVGRLQGLPSGSQVTDRGGGASSVKASDRGGAKGGGGEATERAAATSKVAAATDRGAKASVVEEKPAASERGPAAPSVPRPPSVQTRSPVPPSPPKAGAVGASPLKGPQLQFAGAQTTSPARPPPSPPKLSGAPAPAATAAPTKPAVVVAAVSPAKGAAGAAASASKAAVAASASKTVTTQKTVGTQTAVATQTVVASPAKPSQTVVASPTKATVVAAPTIVTSPTKAALAMHMASQMEAEAQAEAQAQAQTQGEASSSPFIPTLPIGRNKPKPAQPAHRVHSVKVVSTAQPARPTADPKPESSSQLQYY